MKPQTYICKASDPASGLVEGKPVTPYYEDSNEIILDVKGALFNHHIRKSGAYFEKHLKVYG